MSYKLEDNNPIAITGVGVISPAGVGMEILAAALRQGESLVGIIDRFETGDLPCKVAASISDFDPIDFLERRLVNRLDRAGQLFVAASTLATESFGDSFNKIDANRIGIFEGTSLGGLSRVIVEAENFFTRGFRGINPACVNAAMTGAGAGVASILHGVKGPVTTYSNGSISSHSAISAAFHALQREEIDLAIAGGSDAPICRQIVGAFSRARILSTATNADEPVCRPFDVNRNGTVLGEAGAALLLERRKTAIASGRRIFANILGMAQTNDAYSLTAPDPTASQQAHAIELALFRSGLKPDELDYISAHGTGTQRNDVVETAALKESLGSDAYNVGISSSKSLLGHSLGACTAVESIKVITAMQNGFLPSTINLSEPDPECDLDYVPRECRSQEVISALINNSSFGGKNAALVLQAEH